MNEPAPDAPVDAELRETRQAGWTAIERWAARRSNRKPKSEESPKPAPSALRPFRLFLVSWISEWRVPPLPAMDVDAEGSISLRWAGGGWGVTMTFQNDAMVLRRNDGGKVVEEEPKPYRTLRQANRSVPWALNLERYPERDTPTLVE